MVLEPTTPELSESRSALISSQTLPDIQERFAATIWVFHAVPTLSSSLRGLHRSALLRSTPAVASVLCASGPLNQPLRPILRCRLPSFSLPDLINLSGTTRRATLDEFHALHRTRSTPRRALLVPRSSNDMPKTPRVPRRFSILARLWVLPAPVLAPVRPSSTPAALDAPGCSAPYDLAKRKIRRRRPRLTFQRLVAHPTTARTETLPGATPTTPPSPSATPRALGASPPPLFSPQ